MDFMQIRAAIEAEQDMKIHPVPTPEWPTVDGHVFVRTMSSLHKEEFVDAISRIRFDLRPEGSSANIKVFTEETTRKLVAMSACDKDGNLIFTLDDVKMLGSKNAACMQRLIDATSDLNGFSDDAKEKAKNVSSSVTVEDQPTAADIG